MNNKRIAWECKIGCMNGVEISVGGDTPMREAVRKAFIEVTGQEPQVIFSGWGAEFTPSEQAVIRNDGSWPSESTTRPSAALTDEQARQIERAASAVESYGNSELAVKLRAILAASGGAHAVPEGYVLVPIKPTPAMLANTDANPIWKGSTVAAETAWRAMIAAAPTTQDQGEGK